MKSIRLEDGSELTLRYLVQDRDRHGNERVYVRRHKGGRKVRIRDLATVEAFMVAYRAALEGPPETSRHRDVVAPGSLRWLAEQYLKSPEFCRLHESTRAKRRAILEGICREHGAKPFARLEQKHVRLHIRDPKASTPEAANGRVKALREVYRWAVEVGLASSNPTVGVPKLPPLNPDGFHSWTREEVKQFEARHPSGSKARLALVLFLYMGVRISDVIRLGPQMERDGRLSFTEQKNRANKPKHREVPILPVVRAELAAAPSRHLAYLVTEQGRPYASPKAFGNWFKRRCVEAGLPHCTAHGLRKAGATFAAEHGATASQLCAIFGWTNLKHAELYTKAADRNRLTADAMPLLDPDYAENKSVPPDEAVASGGTLKAEKS